MLVPLKNHLVEKGVDVNNESEGKVRVFLGVSILHLIKRLPWELFVIEFSKVVGIVCL